MQCRYAGRVSLVVAGRKEVSAEAQSGTKAHGRVHGGHCHVLQRKGCMDTSEQASEREGGGVVGGRELN